MNIDTHPQALNVGGAWEGGGQETQTATQGSEVLEDYKLAKPFRIPCFHLFSVVCCSDVRWGWGEVCVWNQWRRKAVHSHLSSDVFEKEPSPPVPCCCESALVSAFVHTKKRKKQALRIPPVEQEDLGLKKKKKTYQNLICSHFDWLRQESLHTLC